MWIRTRFQIRVEAEKLRLTIPVPLTLFYHMVDYMEDIFTLTSFFTRKLHVTVNGKKVALIDAKNMINKIVDVTHDMKHCEPFDLVNVESDGCKVLISVR